MPHDTPLIATLVGAFVLAFVLGAVAQRLKLSPLVGYLLAGVLVGPFTPGFVADEHLALELAEIGVILLMFGVGLHFSLSDLLSVKAIAIPGAVVQIGVATLMGMGLTWAMGWNLGAGIVFGIALSVASTVVLLRALQERRMVESEQGRIAVGWLIVEDLAMVLALVLLPALSGALGGRTVTTGTIDWLGLGGDVWTTLAVTLVKVAGFVVLMLVVGRRVIPWIMHWVAHIGSRELFRLAVLAIALGVAFGSAKLFGVSFALGAFFAGMVLSESPLSHRAAEETLPLRDAFAVLFFVSVGMLVDPSIVLKSPIPLLVTVLIVLFGKSIAAFLIVRAFGYGNSTAFTISASLAQIGEFSFILVALGVDLQLLPAEGRDLILAAAIISILANPFFFLVLDRYRARQAPLRPEKPAAAAPAPAPKPVPALPETALTNHTVLVGYGRVGRLVADGLKAAGTPFLVIEDQGDRLEELKRLGLEAVNANAASAPAITAANVAGARRIILAIPDGFEASNVLKKARQLNPGIEIVARAHSDAEVEHLRQSGANFIIMGEREVARGMLAHVLETSQNDIAAAAAAEQAVEGGNRADPSVPFPSGPSVEAAPGLAEPAAAAQKETL
ncbi:MULTISPECIES: YbaL family putative K(+) efflux transporter [Xanthobacter]|uniref:CPA2 family monovalent cation:H+ antiporter-2 n=1 Tax=Xanthobacter flavus TaxID=281 RepID=A0A9W6FKN2_XANFL|nr:MULTISPECIES: YbaL family putative K(+) efflux transporter [Xanthobacter]MDR6333176.1 CPA2 family monovalent cation:H+ antiporter-2 [Xanthobacter flavus]UJX46965.1 Kef family K(+) transporter [Xanthobacter sp. YC-JY1]GLI21452.1 sodium:proton antiporter [Xanthobacter flavus]